MDFKDTSYNFGIAKVLSILMVVTGHYFEGLLWIPTTFALFVFAFSSGFFTANKYKYPVDTKRFWRAKISRLLYPVFVIDVFLFLLLLIQGRPGIFLWQSIPSLLGLSGFFAWFDTGNPSPFGRGLWFFTLLLFFYLLYPLLAVGYRKRETASFFLATLLVLTTLCQYLIPMGHMLWITMFAFIFGAFTGNRQLGVPPLILIMALLLSCVALVFFNTVYVFKHLNYIFILLSSVAISLLLLTVRLPRMIIDRFLLLSGCVLQIYFIHGYLFIRSFTKAPALDYIISLLVIIAAAVFLERISGKLQAINLGSALQRIRQGG